MIASMLDSVASNNKRHLGHRRTFFRGCQIGNPCLPCAYHGELRIPEKKPIGVQRQRGI